MTTTVKIIESTGSEKEDAQILSGLSGTLRNALSFEEAREKERKANQATGSEEPSRNALTEEPRFKGQLLAIVTVEDEEGTEKKSSSLSNKQTQPVEKTVETKLEERLLEPLKQE